MTGTRQTKPTPAFRRAVADLSRGVVLKPLVHAALFDGKVPRFTLEVGGDDHALDFGPDGWFHPSTHPLMAARKLWFYLTAPDEWMGERFEYMGTLSVTMGKIMHRFINSVLWDLGVLVAPEPGGAEPGAHDDETGARGNYDGELRLTIPTYSSLDRQLFEFKTSSPLAKLPDDLDLEAFRKKYPQYYAQVQEYMRMTGLRLAVVLFMALGYPWELREFHIPYDPILAEGVAQKYREVRQMASINEMPPPCCAPGSTAAKECGARVVCPVGRM